MASLALFVLNVVLLSCGSTFGESTDTGDNERGLGGVSPYYRGWKDSDDLALLKADVDKDKLRLYLNTLTKVVNGVTDLTGLGAPHLEIPDNVTFAAPLDIIHGHGYVSAEAINVTTRDNYTLTLWWIKCPKNQEKCSRSSNKSPVLLQHGLLMSGADWLFLDPKNILPYMLADQGYQVFIGNSRGNVYSRNHVHSNTTDYDPNDPDSKYWEFGVHEMGTQDLPAVIDKIKEITKRSKVNYVGYSMGTTELFIYLSERDEYRDSIRKAVAIAPAAYISGLKTPLKAVAAAMGLNGGILPYVILALQQLLLADRDGPVVGTVPRLTEPLVSMTQKLGALLVPTLGGVLSAPPLSMLLCDGSPMVKNRRALQRAIGHQPAGGSLRTVNHFVQFYKSRLFQKFQYDADFDRVAPGLKAPYERNRPFNPPRLYSHRRDVPMLILFGQDDSLVVPPDAMKTVRSYTDNYCQVDEFNHLDFIYGKDDQVVKVYDKILKWLDSSRTTWETKDCL